MKPDEIDTLDWKKGDGLLPAIVQHARGGRVLMLGYVNRDALGQSFATGNAVFFSRSRQRLWMKGETSGNTLAIESIDTDCDRDTLLFSVVPAGPTCHLGTESCFADAMPLLGRLDNVVAERLADRPDGSYTARLAADGIEACARKVAEEATEVVLAAVTESGERLANEAADLLFHLIVVLRRRGLGLDDAVRVLHERHTSAQERLQP